jgi:hypothetical protein
MAGDSALRADLESVETEPALSACSQGSPPQDDGPPRPPTSSSIIGPKEGFARIRTRIPPLSGNALPRFLRRNEPEAL